MSSKSKALQLKEEGNGCFKKGLMAEAIRLFYEAEKVDPCDPVFPANLSAALYETAAYKDSVTTIFRAWSLLQNLDKKDNLLELRLSTRLAKALAQAFCSDDSFEDFIRANSKLINDIKNVSSPSTSQGTQNATVSELKRVWSIYEEVHSNSHTHPQEKKASIMRLSRMPVQRRSAQPHLAYHGMGTDNPFSVLRDWSDQQHGRVYFNKLSSAQLSNLGILFGGVGDGRHAYATLIDVLQQYKTLNEKQKQSFNVHITMLDLHPGILARDLVILMLADQLRQDSLDSESKIEVLATITYTFTAAVIPPYCAERLRNTIQDLRTRLSEPTPRLPKWLHLSPNAVKEVSAVLLTWLTNRFASVNDLLDQKNTRQKPSESAMLKDPTLDPGYKARIKKNIDEKKRAFSKILTTLSVQELKDQGLVPENVSAKQAKRLVNENHDELVGLMYDLMITGDGAAANEEQWFRKTLFFLPPKELRGRHTGMTEEITSGPGLVAYKHGQLETAIQHVRATWEVNPTFYYLDPDRAVVCGNPKFMESCATIMVKFLEIIDLVIPEKQRPPRHPTDDNYVFKSMMVFFDFLGQSIKTMDRHVKVELLYGDMVEELAKMRLKTDVMRPPEFPRTFLRMWLSNVPDYTHGFLNTAVYVLPNLELGPDASVASNSLLTHPSTFASDNEFCHTYTLLPISDVSRYLGCKLLSTKFVYERAVATKLPSPRPLEKLPTRQELNVWLTRQFIYTIRPGRTGSQQKRIILPNNLVAFIGLLVYLHGLGYPGHWLTEFVQPILTDNLVTDIPPYLEEFPIPVSEIHRRVKKRKVRLDPWLPDLENILAPTWRGLPFAVSLPPDFVKSEAEIGTYSTRCTIHNPMLDVFHPGDPNIVLVFYKGAYGISEFKISGSVPDLFEGNSYPPVGDIFILTMQEVVDKRKEIQWKMSRERASEMIRGKWFMMAVRGDLHVPVTAPVPSAQWRELAP